MTLLPAMAQAAARLAVTKVLPSPGSGLVTTRTGNGVSSRMTRRLVRSSRMDSAMRDWGAWSMAMATFPDRTSLSSGSSARIGDSVTEAMSGVFRSRSSNWSRARAIPTPTSSPAISPITPSLALLNPEGAVGSPAATWMDAYGSPSVMFSCSVCRALTVVVRAWISAPVTRAGRLGLEPGQLLGQPGQDGGDLRALVVDQRLDLVDVGL